MAFNIADYQEKYRWSGYDMQNNAVQLRIHERTSTPQTLKSIRGLVDIRLQMQGSSTPVYEPIVKTSLNFTLIDAPDLAGADEKSGNWQEFYTPDSTLYLVELYRGGTPQWRGYITPDSWKESLDYRGGITITARDNLGHLQDLPFDGQGNADGLIQISQIVTDALDAIDFPMTLVKNVNTADCQTLRDTHGYILDSYVCVSELQEGSWWDALEQTLGAIGYTLRFRNAAQEFLAPIRNLPLGPFTSRTGANNNAIDIEFYGGDRELDPAVRQITETLKYGAEMEVDTTQQKTWKYGASTANTYSGVYTGLNGIPVSFTGRSWKNGNTDFATKGGWSNTFGYLNPQRCTISTVLKTIDGARALDMGVGICADQSTDGGVLPAWRVKAPTTDVTLRIEFARPVQLVNGTFPYTVSPFVGYLQKAKLLVSYIDPNGVKWSWQTFGGVNEWTSGPGAPHTYDIMTDTPETMPDSFALDIPLKDISDKTTLGGWLQVEFYNLLHVGLTGTIYGLFDRVTAIKTTLNAKSVLKSDTVTTVNNQDYNVKLERKPEFGPLSAVVPWFSPANYPKAFWAYSGTEVDPVDYAAYLNGYAATTAIPLPAQIAKQILTFSYTPLEILGGTCGAVTKSDRLNFGSLLNYKGKQYVIQGGTLDVLKNRITGAMLHEFAWYADMWDENSNPTYNGNPKYETDSTLNGANGNSAIASGGSGGGGGTGTVTSVALAAPTGFQVTGSPITTSTGSGTIQLTYATGYSLPLTADTAKGVTAYGWGDHSTQGYIKNAAGIIAALGYVPANSVLGLQRPRIKIVRGLGWDGNVMAPQLIASHPLVSNIGPADACFVLMVYNKRRGMWYTKPNYCQYRDKWGEARGRLATNTALTFSHAVTLDTLRLHILNNYVCIYNSPLPTSMTLAQFKVADKPRFGRLANFSSGDFKEKTHGSRLFGIAVRYTNPDFTSLVSGPLVETTRDIGGVPRYIYSDIVPIRVTVGSGSGQGNNIGFQLGVGMA